MSSEQSYLERLKFDPLLLKGPVAWYLSNFRLTLLLIITVIVGGLISYFNLPQRLNPSINIPIVSVTTVLPGASPSDVESLVTIPLEDQLNSLTGLDSMSSFSRENVSVITLQYVSGTNPKSAEQDAQSAVNKATDLPSDAQESLVKAFDFEDQPVWTFALSTEEDDPSLFRFSKQLERAIAKSSKVDRVQLDGFEAQEIQIHFSPEQLRAYGLTAQQLSNLIKRSASSYPAGTVDTGTNNISITIDPQVSTIDDIRDLRINVQNKVVRLGEIATVELAAQANQGKSYLAENGKEEDTAVLFSVFKNRTADINATSDDVKLIVENEIVTAKSKFTITTIENTSNEIRTQFSELLGEFRTTVLLVFLCLFLFVGFRQAIISSFTVPLTFLSAFMIMPFFGVSINFLTLFAFLLALGLLIDDTIVIVSSSTTYFRTGRFSPIETGLLVWRDFIVPIWSTTLTTIWSFVPLLLATGIIGEFIKPIPIVIAITMVSSTAIAVLITLPLMMIILRPAIPVRVINLLRLGFILTCVGLLAFLAPKNQVLPLIIMSFLLLLGWIWLANGWIRRRFRNVSNKPLVKQVWVKTAPFLDKPIISIEPIAEKYKRLIRRVLVSKRARVQVLASIITFAVVSYALVPLGLVKTEFFPKTNEDLFFVNVEFPSGTNMETMQESVPALMRDLSAIPEADFVTTVVGRGVGGGGLSQSGGANTVGYTVHLLPAEERKQTSIEIADAVRTSLSTYPLGKASVVEQSGGPPAGADVQIELSGDELAVLDGYADQIKTHLEGRPGLTNVEKSLKPGTSQLAFIPESSELAKHGLGIETVGLALRTYAGGSELDELQLKGDEEQTKVKLIIGNEIKSPDDLNTLIIQNGQNSIPLLSIGALSIQASPTQINRENQKRTITISATVQPGEANGAEEGKALEKFADGLKLPAGYGWKTGGVNEENSKSVQSIVQAMGLAFVLILITMVIQFRSFRQAFIALMVIPLAISSVFFIFAITGTPLSFPALIGILALFGIIVTNSMFIIDKINMNRKQKMTFVEAIADAGSSRLEPIVLTKLATILGLLPITLSEPLWRGLGGAIISGVLLASSFMLLFIPVVYYAFFAKEELAADALAQIARKNI